jgi:cytochrome P450
LDLNVFGQTAIEMFSLISHVGPTDVHDIMQRMTLDVLGRGLFGMDLRAIKDPTSLYVQYYNKALNAISEPMYAIFPILDWIPWKTKSRREAFHSVSEFRKALYGLIDRRKEELRAGKVDVENADLLTSMILATGDDEDGKALLSSDELVNDFTLLFIAGHGRRTRRWPRDTRARTFDDILTVLLKNRYDFICSYLRDL